MSTVGESSTAGGGWTRTPEMDGSNSVHDDKDEAAEITDDSNNESTGKTPVDHKNLDEILKTFQSQLGLQQKQLELLRSLTKRSRPKRSPGSMRTPTLEDCERAVEWLDARSPSGRH